MADGRAGDRRLRYAAVGAVAVVGFGAGLGLAAATDDDGGDDVVVAAPSAASSTTARPTSTTRPSTSTTAPTTTSTTDEPTTTTTSSAPTTAPSTTAAPPTPAPPAPVTTTPPPPAPVREPLPVATSVPYSPPGTPADLRASYPGQAQGVLRLGLGEDSAIVVSNAGGSESRWTAVTGGGVAIGGQQSVEVVLAPGQSALLPIRTLATGPASVTITSATQSLVVPIDVR